MNANEHSAPAPQPTASALAVEPEIEFDPEPLAASARPLERIGSAHGRAQAVVILGPSFSDDEPTSMIDFVEADPDFQSEPSVVREVIRRHEFPSKLVAVGGVYARILRLYEPAKYRVLWIGSVGETLAQEVYLRPDPEADLKRFARDRQRNLDEAEQLQKEQWAKAAEGEKTRLFRGWARSWLQRFLLEASRRGLALGADPTAALAGVEKWLTENAESFVKVVRVVRGVERRVLPDGRVYVKPAVRPARPHVEPTCDPTVVWRHLEAFLPPKTAAIGGVR